MAKKKYSLMIKGNHKFWDFTVLVDPKYVPEWREDGLVIEELLNVIPVWIVDMGLLRIWCFFQDIFHFRNPLK